MISSIRLINLKFKNFTWKENTSRYLLIIISVAAVLALGWIAGFVILITYILVSLLFKKELQ
jgi:CDP-diacylglycerol--serine O-phosphatidyltransferase